MFCLFWTELHFLTLQQKGQWVSATSHLWRTQLSKVFMCIALSDGCSRSFIEQTSISRKHLAFSFPEQRWGVTTPNNFHFPLQHASLGFHFSSSAICHLFYLFPHTSDFPSFLMRTTHLFHFFISLDTHTCTHVGGQVLPLILRIHKQHEHLNKDASPMSTPCKYGTKSEDLPLHVLSVTSNS